MKIYEGYYNEISPEESDYLKKYHCSIKPNEYLLEQICNNLGLEKYTRRIIESLSINQLLEENGLVRVFDNYLDKLANLIIDNKNKVKRIDNPHIVSYYDLPTDLVFKYDNTIKDNRYRASVDLYQYHNKNGIIEQDWHRIIFKLNNNLYDYESAVYPRNIKRPQVNFLTPEEEKVWLNNDNIYITFNYAKLYDDIYSESYIEQIKDKLNHEFTHILPRWAHKNKDILCTKKNLMTYLDEFDNLPKKYMNMVIKVRRIIHNVKNMELDAFYNQFMKYLESKDDAYFENIFNKTNDLDKQVHLVITSTYNKNHVIDINADLYEIAEDINFNKKRDCLYILLLSFYFRKYTYIECAKIYDNILTIDNIYNYANDNSDIDINIIKNLHRKIKKIFFGAYKDYIEKKLPKKIKKFLQKKKSKLQS